MPDAAGFVTGLDFWPYSETAVAGTRQRFSTPSQRRQCGLCVLRMFVTPVSGASWSSGTAVASACPKSAEPVRGHRACCAPPAQAGRDAVEVRLEGAEAVLHDLRQIADRLLVGG